MLRIYRHRPVTIEWTIFRSRGIRENFRNVKLYIWLCGESDRYQIETNVSNPLTFAIPSDLPTGDYSIVAMWSKGNYQTFVRNGKLIDDALCKTRLDGAFALVDINESPELANKNTVLLRCSSITEVYGYDGLDAYQIATLRGFKGSESDWLKSQRYVKVLDEEGTSTVETMSQKAITDAHEELRKSIASLKSYIDKVANTSYSFEEDDDDNPLTDNKDYPDISDILNS